MNEGVTGPDGGWGRLEEAFDQLVECDPSERERALSDLQAGDRRLAEEVRALLASHDAIGPFDALLGVYSDPAPSPTVPSGTRIGPFEVVRELGHGGMGAVYLGERSGDGFVQQVALKRIRVGFDSEELRRRFRLEQRALARLTHPGIARMIEAGVDRVGAPYLAMELVDGTPILEYCDSRRLSIRSRIELFLGVCEAVQYAHGRLVVHRDLKPGNVLVTESGRAKLLDFGIAKLLEDDAHPTRTLLRGGWLTPDYASPEQIRGTPVTTASDLYSLGVLLFELLTGHRPYRVGDATPAEVERIVCESDPVRPSAAVTRTEPPSDSAEPVGPDSVSRSRSTHPDRLRREIAGDLDTILLKSLAKEPEQRYRSVEAFADDLRRHLAGRPVAAHPPSRRYRLSRFVARNRAAVAGASAVAVSVAAAMVGVVWQAEVATAERDRARQEAEKASTAIALLTDLFRLSDPRQPSGDDVTAREVLDNGAERVRAELAGEPELQATLLGELSSIYANLGLFERGRGLADQVLALRTGPAHEGPHAVADALDRLGWIEYELGELESAEARFRDALGIRRDGGTGAGPGLAASHHGLGRMLMERGVFDTARAHLREALDLRRVALGPTHPDVAESAFRLAAAHHATGSYDEAEALFREAVDVWESLPGTPDALAADAAENLGMILRFRRRYADAEPFVRDALRIRNAHYEPDHPLVLTAHEGLAGLLHDMGRSHEAEPHFRAAVEGSLPSFGQDHPQVARMRQGLAVTLHAQGDSRSAEPILRDVRRVHATVYGPDHGLTVYTTLYLGEVLLGTGQIGEAAEMFAEGLAVTERTMGVRHPYRAWGLRGLARTQRDGGELEAAEASLRRAAAVADSLVGAEHSYSLLARTDLAEVLTELGRPVDAEAILNEVLDTSMRVLPPRHRELGRIRAALGRASLARGQVAEARIHLLAALEILEVTHVEGARTRAAVEVELAALGSRSPG